MSKPPPKYDRRLIGTWKSDRRRTFRNWKWSSTATPKRIRFLKSLFGKLIIRWTRTRYYAELDGYRSVEKYDVVARDDDSVVIRARDWTGEQKLTQIHFEGEDWYWVPAGVFQEWFRRIK